MGCIYRRRKKLADGTLEETGPYWIKYSQNGRAMQESTKSFHRKDAERLLKKREGFIASGQRVNLRLEKLVFSELLDDLLLDYRAKGQAERFAKNIVENHLRPYFGRILAIDIGTSDIRKYTEFRRTVNQGTTTYKGRLDSAKQIAIRPASNATINRELALLKRAFNLGRQNTPRKVETCPHVPMLKEDNIRKGFFDYEDFLTVRQHLPADLKAFFSFAFYTGCRLGEIQNLKITQLDLQARIVVLHPGTTKNDEGRILPLTGELYELLVMQAEIRKSLYPDCPWLFSRHGGLQVKSFRRSWQTACLKSGLEGDLRRVFHDLRRSGVRNLVRAGVPEVVAMRISGHKTRAVFDRYNIVNERDLKEATKKLDKYFSEKEEMTRRGYSPVTACAEKADLESSEDPKLLN